MSVYVPNGILDPKRADPRTAPILQAGDNLDRLDGGQLDDLTRAASTLLQAVQREHDRRQGVRITHPARPPWRHSHEPWWAPRWWDHAYKLVGRPTWVAEPYNVGGDGLADLAALDGDGWDVSLTAHGARWFPGRTLRVVLTRSDRPSAEVSS